MYQKRIICHFYVNLWMRVFQWLKVVIFFFVYLKKNIVKIKLHCKYFIFKFIGWFRNSFWWVFFLKFLHFKFQVQTELVHVHIKPCTLIKTTIHNLHSYWFPFVHTCKFIFCIYFSYCFFFIENCVILSKSWNLFWEDFELCKLFKV